MTLHGFLTEIPWLRMAGAAGPVLVLVFFVFLFVLCLCPFCIVDMLPQPFTIFFDILFCLASIFSFYIVGISMNPYFQTG